MNPNKAFKQRNEPTRGPIVHITFSKHKFLDITCRKCNFMVSLSMLAGISFTPSFFACAECGSSNWEYNLDS